MKRQYRLNGFSLAELLLGMALFALLITSVASFSIDAVRAVRNSSTKVVAAQRIQEMSNALLLNKDALWSTIISNTNAGSKSLVYQNNTYTFQDGAVSDIGISLQLSITQAYRDALGNIVTTGGTLDIHSRAITFTAQWVDFLGISNAVSSTVYVSDWNTLKLLQTTDTEFATGTNNGTAITKTADGEVTMETVIYADWCKPSLTITNADLPGQGVAQTISAIAGKAFIGTGANASGLSFINVGIAPNNPPTITTLGTFDGNKTNAVFGDGSYAYLATDTNSEEVVILNIVSPPYTQVGYFDSPGSTNAKGVVTSGNYGFMITESNLYSFNLTSKSGSRPQLGSLAIGGEAKKLFIRGNYLYIAVSDNTANELLIVDISNPSALNLVGTANVAGVDGVSVYVNTAGTRAYLATATSASQREVFIIDVTNKSGNRGSIGSYDTNGMNPKDITAPEGYARIVVGGSGGTEQYQVITTDTESNPQYCGGLAVSLGVNGVASITEANGDTYSYVLTGDSSKEMRVVKGGPGGGNSSGYGYLATADYTSSVLDAASTTPYYYSVELNSTVPGNSTLLMQIRAASTSDMAGSTWVGPDGTSATYFTGATGTALPVILNDKQYFQYKLFFTSSDTVSTAILNQIEFTYQK